MNRTALYLLTSICIFVACNSGKSSVDELAVSFSERLEKSNRVINNFSVLTLNDLEGKLNEPATRWKAEEWYPKADSVMKETQLILNYTTRLKEKLRAQPKIQSLPEADQIELKTRLDIATVNILKISPLFSEILAFSKVDSVITRLSQNHHSHKVMSAQLLAMESVIHELRNRLVTHCNEQVSDALDHFTVFTAIVGQSSNFLLPGEKIEIMAGVGAFTRRSEPVISIQGKNIPLGEDGSARYSFRVPKKFGLYKVPVRIRYKDEFGQPQATVKTIEYRVMKECDE